MVESRDTTGCQEWFLLVMLGDMGLNTCTYVTNHHTLYSWYEHESHYSYSFLKLILIASGIQLNPGSV